MRVTNTTSWILSLAASRSPAVPPGTTATSTSAADSRRIRSCSTSRSPTSRARCPRTSTDLEDLDVRELETFMAGADVWLRDRAAPDVPERNITSA